jgi:hypothetical protein
MRVRVTTRQQPMKKSHGANAVAPDETERDAQ